MDNTRFFDYSGNIDDWLDLTYLEKLTIQGCTNVASFLLGLIDVYTNLKDHVLNSLTISEESDTPWIEALEQFLENMSGLDYLYVSTSNSRWIEPVYVCCHGATLRYLVMDPLNKWNARLWDDGGLNHIYHTTELRRLAKECQHVEEFGTSLVQLDFWGRPSTEPFVWQPKATQSPREQCLVSSLVSASHCLMEDELIHIKDALATFQSFVFCD
jgi:hypothetical protein